jgi:hypothetical protein
MVDVGSAGYMVMLGMLQFRPLPQLPRLPRLSRLQPIRLGLTLQWPRPPPS